MIIRLQTLAILIAACGTIVVADPPKTDAPEGKFEISRVEKEVLELTNAERAKENLPALKPHPLLFQVARDHSKNMAKQEKMEHILDGVKPHERTKKAGYNSPFIGENIAAGEAFFPKEVVKVWMESKPHRENMLKKDFVYIGIGMARSEKGEYYYTQVFGRAPRP
jgi:uncharacterized protein YkwD